MGGYFHDTGQYDHHVFAYNIWLCSILDAESYRRLL